MGFEAGANAEVPTPETPSDGSNLSVNSDATFLFLVGGVYGTHFQAFVGVKTCTRL